MEEEREQQMKSHKLASLFMKNTSCSLPRKMKLNTTRCVSLIWDIKCSFRKSNNGLIMEISLLFYSASLRLFIRYFSLAKTRCFATISFPLHIFFCRFYFTHLRPNKFMLISNLA